MLECVGAGRAAVLVCALVEVRGAGRAAVLVRGADEDAARVADGCASDEVDGAAVDVEGAAVDALLVVGAGVSTRYTGSDRLTL